MKNNNTNSDEAINVYDRRNTQDWVFHFLSNNVEEFPRYITGYDDIGKREPNDLIDDLLKRSELDSLYSRENGIMINLEHQSQYNNFKILRNTRYLLELIEKGYNVEQWVVYTGKNDITGYYSNQDIFVKTHIIQSRRIESTKILNNIYFKIGNNTHLNAYDVLDVCSFPVINHGKSNEEVVDIILDITRKCKTKPSLLNILTTCVAVWTTYLLDDGEKINEIVRELKMMGKVGFKEMWEYIEQERFRKIIKSKDEEISEMSQIIEDLLQYAPDDVKKDYRNSK
ncbi:hypothetical protein [Methanobrevibacter millerae]|uniref:Transposase n=1 Tax=Methanobrevibacter millerae TaxID=230361 RepID=A0A1G5VCW3_9EURY|nr:hypothetical protein [Methanobrevibacter millerae]SDA42875.1 hypothetical protein SAMN02910315_00482 [Methanobrevibacter millerae]